MVVSKLLQYLFLASLGSSFLVSPSAFAENNHVAIVRDKAYVAILSADRISRGKAWKKAALQEAANHVCAFEVKPYGQWKAKAKGWTLVKTYDYNVEGGVPKPRRNRMFMRVAHKIFDTVTCTSNFSLGEMMKLNESNRNRPQPPLTINTAMSALSDVINRAAVRQPTFPQPSAPELSR